MNKFLFFVLFILFILLVNTYLNNLVFPNTFLSNDKITNKSKKYIANLLKENMKIPVQIKVKNRVYQYYYEDLGISINYEKTIESVFEENKKSFFNNIINYIQSLSSQKKIMPILVFDKKLNEFCDDSIYDFSEDSDEIAVDEENKTFIYNERQEKYKIDAEDLKIKIIFGFGNEDKAIEPKLIKLVNIHKDKVDLYNKQLNNVFNEPIQVIIKGEGDVDEFAFSSQDLKKMIKAEYMPKIEELRISINEKAFKTITSQYAPFQKKGDKKIPLVKFKKQLALVIHSRLIGNNINEITAYIETSPNSYGNLSEKYIEVDISQQKMYLFSDGNLVNSYTVSTGIDHPTPVGTFKILNKQENAWSNIYNVWMPYWMAFSYSSRLDAYFGIHEIPYWLVSRGYRLERPKDFIGTPNTGGCVALHTGDAREVYDFAHKDMPLYIYK